MSLLREIWLQDIQENLFAQNPFMGRATDHSSFVNYKTVHIPQAGANPSIIKNVSSLPLTASQRTDSDLTYSLNQYSTPVTVVTDIEALQISYNKRMSVMGNNIKSLGNAIANNTLYSWAVAGAAAQVRTTGTADALALAPSATGTRKAITLADISSAKAILDKANVPQEGRVLIMPSDIYNSHFLAINNVQVANSYGSATLPSGVVNRIFGFDIMIRPSVLVFDNTGTPVIKAVGDDGVPSAPAATDNMACLAYHPDFVSVAKGDTKIYDNVGRAEYQGDTISAMVMHGASKLRTTGTGIVQIIQAA